MASRTLAIAGLGNPGPEYRDTRHNAGFWFVDRLAGRRGWTFKPRPKLSGEECRERLGDTTLILFKPTTWMNHSGQAVRALLDWYKLAPADLIVVHDDLDLPPGTARLKEGGGHGGHNGLRDIDRHLGTQAYLRLRIGIGHPGDAALVTPYVLSRPPAGEQDMIEAAFERALDVLPLLAAGEVPRAMNELHRSPPPDTAGP